MSCETDRMHVFDVEREKEHWVHGALVALGGLSLASGALFVGHSHVRAGIFSGVGLLLLAMAYTLRSVRSFHRVQVRVANGVISIQGRALVACKEIGPVVSRELANGKIKVTVGLLAQHESRNCIPFEVVFASSHQAIAFVATITPLARQRSAAANATLTRDFWHLPILLVVGASTSWFASTAPALTSLPVCLGAVAYCIIIGIISRVFVMVRTDGVYLTTPFGRRFIPLSEIDDVALEGSRTLVLVSVLGKRTPIRMLRPDSRLNLKATILELTEQRSESKQLASPVE